MQSVAHDLVPRLTNTVRSPLAAPRFRKKIKTPAPQESDRPRAEGIVVEIEIGSFDDRGAAGVDEIGAAWLLFLRT